MSPILDAADLADKHRYLATHRPDWRRSMAAVRRDGGPWPCPACGNASLLCYRCSACGRDLVSESGTHGRQG